jgi:hypothetical protein
MNALLDTWLVANVAEPSAAPGTEPDALDTVTVSGTPWGWNWPTVATIVEIVPLAIAANCWAGASLVNGPLEVEPAKPMPR